MKQYYLFTSDDISHSLDFANGERNTVNVEDAELLPKGGKWLTRGEVEKVLRRLLMHGDLGRMLDELFGEEGDD